MSRVQRLELQQKRTLSILSPAKSAKTTGRRTALAVSHVAMICLIVAQVASAVAQEKPPDYAVKAAYLYNFGKFAKWPSEGSRFNICVLGRDPFRGSLDRTVAGEQMDGRPIATHSLSELDQVHQCQILFIGNSERSRLPTILAAVRNEPILTVSDMPEFVNRGGMIQFELDDNRVCFSINLHAAREAHLDLSSDLLKVALRVEGR